MNPLRTCLSALLLAALFGLLPGCGDRPLETKYQSVSFPGNADGEAKPERRRAIVFIHGIFGDPKSTWASAEGISWFTLMRADRAFQGFDLHSVGYYSPKLGKASDIDEIANRFVQTELPEILRAYDEVHFVVHSMGGLVVKRALTKLHISPGDAPAHLAKVGAVVFISTPAQGANLADWASWIAANPQLRNMRTDETFLNSIDSDWQNLLRKRSSANRGFPAAYCAYETLPTLGAKVVPRLYSQTFCDRDPVAFDFDHIEIVKPKSADHPVFKWARQQLLDATSRFHEVHYPQHIRTEFISAVGGIRTLQGLYLLSYSDKEVAHQLLSKSDAAIARLASVNPKSLKPSDRPHRHAYIANGYMYQASARDLVGADNAAIKAAAQQSLKYSELALQDFLDYKREAEHEDNVSTRHYAEWLRWAAEEHYEQFIHQISGRAYLLLFKIGERDSQAAKDAFSRVTRKYFRDNNLQHDHLIKWVCSKHRNEVPVCK